MPDMYSYPGTELDLFAKAIRWKTYFSSILNRYVQGDVLEVGAGTGINQPYLMNESVSSWTSLEPDAALLQQLKERLDMTSQPVSQRLIVGALSSLPDTERFDSILYVDVLEHIEADAAELQQASHFLKPGGRIVVLAPAHPSLMSPFDRAIGHYRRYNQSRLKAIAPAGFITERMFYLDSVGWLASAANRFVLKQSMPKPNQILFWDRWMVPISTWLDPITGYRLGKSIVAVWQKKPA